MTKVLLAICTFMLFTAFAPTNDSILGIWKATEMENSTIEVYRNKDGLIYGKIISSDEQDFIDKLVLKKAKYDPEDNVWRGEIYSLKKDMTIDVTLSLISDKKLKIVGKKYFVTKTFYWEK